jgi:hypothetical protein
MMNERNAQAQENSTQIAAQAGLEKQALANQGRSEQEAMKAQAQMQNEDPLGLR